MSLKLIGNKTAIHCETEDLAKRVIEIIIKEQNIKWATDSSIEINRLHYYYGINHCYFLKNKETLYTCELSYSKSVYHNIIKAQDFINANTVDPMENLKEGDKLICIDNDNGYDLMVEGNIYTFKSYSNTDGRFINVEDNENKFNGTFLKRFVLYEETDVIVPKKKVEIRVKLARML